MMHSMFNNAIAFNQPLAVCDTSSVRNMQYMFEGAKEFNQPLWKWDTSSVTEMQYMLSGAIAFNHTLSDWKFSHNSLVDLFAKDMLSDTAIGKKYGITTPEGLDENTHPYFASKRRKRFFGISHLLPVFGYNANLKRYMIPFL